MIDAYFTIFKMKSHPWKAFEMKDGILKQPASRFLRPPGNIRFFNSLRIKRIKKEMTYAAQKGQVYHLWWHPHNFAVDSKLSLAELASIFEHFKTLQSTYGMQSMNMSEVTQYYTAHA